MTAAGVALMDLDLAEPALSAATDFSQAFPWAVFTSGRRSMELQAWAMAGNVVRNRDWIRGGEHPTYKPSPCADACQAWVWTHPEATTQAEIAAGLLAVTSGYSDEEIAKMTVHPSGLAFDVQPIGVKMRPGQSAGSWADEMARASRACAWLGARAAKVGGRFLQRENGLVIWHWQAVGGDAPALVCCA